MEWLLGVGIQHEMSLDELAFPKDHVTLLGSTEHFTVWKFGVSRHVGELELAKLGDFALELESSEGLGHFPELDMGES